MEALRKSAFFILLSFNLVLGQDSHILLAAAPSLGLIDVIDLSNPARDCEYIQLQNFLYFESYLDATFVNDELLICGDSPNLCYRYDDNRGDWHNAQNRNEFRSFAYGIDLIDENKHWVSGGNSSRDGDILISTEMFNGDSWTPSVDLPVPLVSHCTVSLGNGQVFISGDSKNPTAHIMDLNTGEFVDIGYPTLEHADNIMCGLATKSDGTQLVVMAGGDVDTDEYDGLLATASTYLYDLSAGVFLPGRNLPHIRTRGRAVQRGNSILIVGGGDSAIPRFNTFQPEIWSYDPDGDRWVTLPQTMLYADYVTAAIIVPDSFNVNC